MATLINAQSLLYGNAYLGISSRGMGYDLGYAGLIDFQKKKLVYISKVDKEFSYGEEIIDGVLYYFQMFGDHIDVSNNFIILRNKKFIKTNKFSTLSKSPLFAEEKFIIKDRMKKLK